MQLIATQEFHYDGKTRKVGDLFEAPDIHGKMFINSGRAKAKDKKYHTEAIKAEEAPQPVPVQHNPRARYKRRDMRPQE